MAQLSQSEPLSHKKIKYVKEVVMKWSSALFEKKKKKRGTFFFILLFFLHNEYMRVQYFNLT